MRRRLLTILVALVLIGVATLVVVHETGHKKPGHTIVANFESATNLVSGANVTAGGATIGSVGSIKLVNGIAQVQLHIKNPEIWPLHQGTNAEIRWGGTLSYSNRYVEILPGPAKDPILRNGALLPTQDTVTPVEFDQLFNVFSAPARASLGRLVVTGASTFEGKAKALHNGITAAAPALTSVSGVLQQLGEDPYALETLVSAGASTATALHEEQPQLDSLVANAADTFTTISDNARATQATLRQLAPALDSADTALDRLSPTLTKLNGLVVEIKPGTVRLKALAAPLDSALTELTTVAPQLNSTLVDVQRGAPNITTLLDTAKPVLATARTTLKQTAPILGCVRPYAPEFGGFVETWDSFLSGYNSAGHYARALFQAFPATNDSTETPADLVASDKSIGYALIRPPGYDADNSSSTWLQPQCGAGQNGLTAADDPENP
jgi:phospholipid/cholesterol/gamma-HCH transport system substrate-binding protein